MNKRISEMASYKDVIDLNELYTDVALIAEQVEELLSKIAHVATEKEAKFHEASDALNKEKNHEQLI